MRYSRQRECIYEILKNTKCHPDATYVYEKAREEIPNISLGTVYRNLKSLEETGEITKVPTPFPAERYDADISNHYHYVCLSCGEVIDLEMNINLTGELLKQTGLTAKGHKLVYYGICNKCKKQENNKI